MGAEGTGGTWVGPIFAVTLVVADLDASKRFYHQAFGLPTEFEDSNSAIFRFGATLINLLDARAAPELLAPARHAPPSAGARCVFTIHVDDVDLIAEQLQARGVELLNGPIDRPWGPRTASFADLDGHIWEIAKP